MNVTRKVLSGILTVAMLISMLPMSISAACTHHAKHDEACGYVAEIPCKHTGENASHDAICGYVKGNACEHEHSALCSTKCIHEEHNGSCKYVEEIPCKHTTHDAECGYAAEIPCNYDFENCVKCKEELAKATYPNSPVYIIKSGEGSFILNKYEAGVMVQTETKNSNDLYTPMKFVDNANYAPFRYLFEEFGLEEASADLCTASNPEDLNAFDMSAIPVPDGKAGVYIALYNYGEGKDKRIEIDGSKRIVLLVKLASNPTEKVVLIEGKDLSDSKGRPIYDENGNKVLGQVKILDNSTYIPLRALQLCGMHVRYDANAKAAYIFPKSVDYTAKEQELLKGVYDAEKIEAVSLDGYADEALYNNAAKVYNGMISNSYVNYSKAYKKPDGSVSFIDNAYSVNQVGDYLVYVDESLKISVAKMNEKGALELFPVISDTIFLCDTVIFDGYNVYGIKAKNADSVSGNVFVAKLTKTNEGYRMFDYKEVSGVVSARALRLSGNKLYFIDDSDRKIKSVSTSGNGLADVAQVAGEEIFAFDVCGENVFYDNNDDKAYLNGEEFPNADGTYVREVVANQGYNGGEGVLFYYTLESGDANYLYTIRKDANGNVTSVLEDCKWNGHKLRNLTMLDGKVYATASGNLTVLK